MSDNNATTTAPAKVERQARLRWVALGQMNVPPLAQRTKLNLARVDHIAANLDLELIGTPTLNERGGRYYIMDGWHRTEALKAYGFTAEDKIQCWTYSGLTEQDEAEQFLKLNDTLTVDAYSKFRVSVNAGRVVECDVERVVRAQGLVISQDHIDGAIGAVGTLVRVYNRNGAAVLARTLRIVRDSYGDPGMEAIVIDGIGLLCGRYNGDLEDQVAVAKLSKAHGGVAGLINRAEQVRRSTGIPKGQAIAAAAVDVINAGRGGKKIPAWWREDAA